jgi:hypothetical protein
MSMKNWNLDPLALWSAWLKILDAQAKIAQDNQTNRLEILTALSRVWWLGQTLPLTDLTKMGSCKELA